MPSATPKADESLHWTPCADCHRRHKQPGSPCPPIGVWLVLTLCPACAAAGTYCYNHRGRT